MKISHRCFTNVTFYVDKKNISIIIFCFGAVQCTHMQLPVVVVCVFFCLLSEVQTEKFTFSAGQSFDNEQLFFEKCTFLEMKTIN